jgi:antitoxin component HigA of HigAB toxin-antitoxin module
MRTIMEISQSPKHNNIHIDNYTLQSVARYLDDVYSEKKLDEFSQFKLDTLEKVHKCGELYSDIYFSKLINTTDPDAFIRVIMEFEGLTEAQLPNKALKFLR